MHNPKTDFDPLPPIRDERDELLDQLRNQLQQADAQVTNPFWRKLPTWLKALLVLVVCLGVLWAAYQVADWWTAHKINSQRTQYESEAGKLKTELEQKLKAIALAQDAQAVAELRVAELETELTRLRDQNIAFQATLSALALKTNQSRIVYEQTQNAPRNDFNVDADYTSELQRLRARQERLGVAPR